MRLQIPLAISIVLTCCTDAAAQDDAKATIEKAIEAHGGADKLDKFLAGQVQSKGLVAAQAGDVPFTSVVVYQLPDRVKATMEFAIAAGPRSITQVLNGDKVGAVIGGIPQQVTPAQAEELKQAAHARNVVRLTPLLKGDKYKLSSAGEKEIAGATGVGVKVTADGAREITVYFDKATNLLLALERQGFDAAGKQTDQQEIFSEYKTAEGIKYPARTAVMQNGKRYIASEVLSFKPMARVDSREFTIPQ